MTLCPNRNDLDPIPFFSKLYLYLNPSVRTVSILVIFFGDLGVTQNGIFDIHISVANFVISY